MAVRTNGQYTNLAYTQIFRSGIIEATKVRLLAARDGQFGIPARTFVEPIYRYFPQYMRALEALNVPPPFAVSISLIGVERAVLRVSDLEFERFPIDRHVLQLPLQTISSFGNDRSYREALAPAIDALWNAAGLASAREFLANYNEAGQWAGPQ